MKKNLSLLLASFTVLINACSVGQASNNLSAAAFAQKIKETPGAMIIDVRTQDEFSKGHLVNAKNINWNGDDFDTQVATIDKSRPVFVYCLSGGRSSSAAEKLRSDGFKQVYELKGGIMKWRKAALPETKDNTIAMTGMNKAAFDSMIGQNKVVLVDFYADWCEPCKQMKPYLEEIQKENEGKLLLMRINTDDNQSLTRELNIDGLPTLQLYKNKTLKWTGEGLIRKDEIIGRVKQFL